MLVEATCRRSIMTLVTAVMVDFAVSQLPTARCCLKDAGSYRKRPTKLQDAGNLDRLLA